MSEDLLARMEAMINDDGDDVITADQAADETEVEQDADAELPEQEEVAEAEEQEPETEEVETETETVEIDAELIAQALGLDASDVFVDDDGKVGVRAKVNGEEQRVNLAELRKSYQLQKNLDDKAHKLNQEREAFGAWQQGQQQQWQQQAQFAHELLGSQAEALAQRFNTVNWDQLRSEDPAEWAAKKQEFQTAYQQIQGKQAELAQRVQYTQQAQQQQFQEQYQKHLAEEAQQLADKLPEWSDETVANRERQEIAEYMAVQGFQPQEMTISDHRALLILRKAMLYDKQANAQPGAKKVRKVARIMPTGTQRTAAQKTKSKRDNVIKRLRKTGSERDAMEAILGMNID